NLSASSSWPCPGRGPNAIRTASNLSGSIPPERIVLRASSVVGCGMFRSPQLATGGALDAMPPLIANLALAFVAALCLTEIVAGCEGGKRQRHRVVPGTWHSQMPRKLGKTSLHLTVSLEKTRRSG